MENFETKEDGILYFKKLGYKIKEGPNWFVVVAKEEELKLKENNFKKFYGKNICCFCGEHFLKTASVQFSCGCCKIFFECKNCKKYFEFLKIKEENRNKIINNEILNKFCRNCSSLNASKLATIRNIELWNDLEWSKNQKQRVLKNLEFAHKYWKDKPNLNPLSEANKNKIKNIKLKIDNLNLILIKNSIDVSKIEKLKKNDICGSYVIKAKFKDDLKTNNENCIYPLLVCKSKYIYDEIRWILRVLSQPEKQDKNAEWTIAKWWYIANLYYDFEFELLTDPNGVSDEEALLYEAKYAIDNDLFVEFKSDNNKNRIPNIKKHAYFSL